METFTQVEGIDADLTREARSAGALRLAIGIGLEAMGKGGYRQLGFPSLAAYALERCERRGRWVEQSRTLARRTAELPALRRALISGVVSWSQAVVIAAVAKPEDEARWVLEAQTLTVRELEEVARARRGNTKRPADPATEDEPHCTLTVTVNAEDAWLFECATMIVRHLDGQGARAGDVLEAALLEGASSLAPRIPAGHTEPDDDAEIAAQRSYEAQREAWRLQAEKQCERTIPRGPVPIEEMPESSMVMDGSVESIDARLRSLSEKLASLSLRVGELAEPFFRADGWRRLGYATARQYARERLGISLSSLNERRRVARGIRCFPAVGQSVRSRRIGFEAARLVTTVATPATQAAWATHAEQRTVVLLREDVRTADLLRRLGLSASGEPPTDEAIAAVRELEHQIITGECIPQKVGNRSVACLPPRRVPVDEAQRNATTAPSSGACDPAAVSVSASVSIVAHQISAALAPCTAKHGAERTLHAEPALIKLEQALATRARPSRSLRSRARTTLRLRVPNEVRRLYRRMERLHLRYGHPGTSFLGYCSSELIASWAHARPPVAYASVYRRDGHRCQNPVCGKRHVTPHHVVFRGHGGSDEDSNVVSLCAECHLEGVHRGHIEVTGKAPELRWGIGRGRGRMVVEGRRRCARRSGPRVSPLKPGRPRYGEEVSDIGALATRLPSI